MSLMEIDKCNSCQGVDKCRSYCALHAGKALVNFIYMMDTIETKIGEYSSREIGGKHDLIFYGHQIYDVKSPSWLLTDISTTLDITNKFKNAFDKNVIQIAKEYLKHVEVAKNIEQDIIDRIRKINANKLLALPFRPQSRYLVSFNDSGKKRLGEINNIKWVTNKTTNKLECTITFIEIGDPDHTTIRLSVEDYLDKFTFESHTLSYKVDANVYKWIKTTKHGFFKPIEFTDKNVTVAIDGTYLYYTANNETIIIGGWTSNNNLVLMNNNIKNDIVNKILKNADFLSYHRKYIAPYSLYEANKINLK